MRAQRVETTVQENGTVALKDLAFDAGERVEVIVLARDAQPSTTIATRCEAKAYIDMIGPLSRLLMPTNGTQTSDPAGHTHLGLGGPRYAAADAMRTTMSHIAAKIPEWVVRHAQELAEKEDIPLDQFVALAMAEKVSSLLTVDYLSRRAEQGSIDNFPELLAKAPDVEPDPSDRLV